MMKSRIVRRSAAVMGATAVGLGLSVAAPATANAVKGAEYSKSTCQAHGKKGEGVVFGQKAEWRSYECLATANGTYRLNVYHVSPHPDTHMWAFAGAKYSTKNKCENAGSKKSGVYKGHKVGWAMWSCSDENRLMIGDVS